uniref:Uncharacterized protein n=1 Tax=Ditylenchus dipsaci TaxID=166011 RepID=A0A915CTC1_9BILA
MSTSAAYLRKIEKRRCFSASSSAVNIETKRSGILYGISNRLGNGKAGSRRRFLSKKSGDKSLPHGFISKYQNRRSQLLKSGHPFRSPLTVSRVATKNSIWVRKQRLRANDIVGVTDSVTQNKYFGQVSTFLTDAYAKNYVILTWLVPKQGILQRHSFQPENFVHGIAEERPIPAESCEFLCSCPLIPRYMRPWSKEQLTQEQIRRELSQRVEEIRGTVKEVPPSIKDDFKMLAKM